MAIVASDFHGNVSKCRRFLEYKPEEEHVFAGDAVDSYNESAESQLKVLNMLLESNCILLYGNHELSYHRKHRMECSGRHYTGMQTFPTLLDNPRWKLAHVADDYLITHAGVSEKHVFRYNSINNLAKRINKDLAKKTNGVFDVGFCRGGFKSCGGPLWFDFRFDHPGLSQKFNQVFGHCSLLKPYEEKTATYHHACINSNDNSDDCWVFDTEEKKIIIL